MCMQKRERDRETLNLKPSKSGTHDQADIKGIYLGKGIISDCTYYGLPTLS